MKLSELIAVLQLAQKQSINYDPEVLLNYEDENDRLLEINTVHYKKELYVKTDTTPIVEIKVY